ncbi:patatin-like phospholipase family protein [Spirosoma validum]|uniref:Patatin-like phospholipase family protein n=1 Tax=Spirosoma validum TaxID=2771355 RepID=A0A927B105_9BACT|nr:patatin-like phospholipase family protein [Spirosoma validum]MBD2753433.1 patatin-like phospholipase family protein [Spirosoma validum]
MSIQQKLEKTGPRKLLALDGGGIRGTITIEILAKIESLLQKDLDRDDTFVLADYFDYIAGTSTGAIIATCLSLGMRVDAIRKFYQESGSAMFDKASLLKRFRYTYEKEKLTDKLKEVIGKDTTLGDGKLKTLLLLVMRNATTDSPWPVSNNPKAKYNAMTRSDSNLKFPLWQLVRASTAAPTYFPPESIQVGANNFIFVDGGVTMYNNPAFQLFLMATVEPYALQWPTGEDNMLIVSVGTGSAANANANLAPDEMNLIYNATSIPSALMYAASNEQDFLCRVFGKCLHGDELDQEVGNMCDVKGPTDKKLFSYVRYNANLSRRGLDDLGLLQVEPEHVQKMDSVDYINELQEVGKAVAEQKVEKTHFANFLS